MTTAALLWPRPGDPLRRRGRRQPASGVTAWQASERRRLHHAPLLVSQAAGALDEAGAGGRRAVVVPIAVEPSRPPTPAGRASDRDGGQDLRRRPAQEGPGPRIAAWSAVRREGEELIVTGTDRARPPRGASATPERLARRVPRAAAPRPRLRSLGAPARGDQGWPSSRRWPTGRCW